MIFFSLLVNGIFSVLYFLVILQLSPESVADLVDLEQELNSLQRGITQMERITPNEVHQTRLPGSTNDLCDPFGDSFTNFPVRN